MPSRGSHILNGVAKTLYFDCFSGASGDMVIGALLDLGLPIDELRAALGSLAVEYGGVSAERVLRAGVSATKFRVHEWAAPASGAHTGHVHPHDHDHVHSHDAAPPHTHAHQHSLKEISGYIDRSAGHQRRAGILAEIVDRHNRNEQALSSITCRVHDQEAGEVDSARNPSRSSSTAKK